MHTRWLVNDPRRRIIASSTAVVLYLPVVLVREVEKSTRHASLLQNIEEEKAFGHWKTEIQVVVDDKMRSGPIRNVIDGVESFIVVTVVPESAIELEVIVS